jgi:hypothetical protein
MQMQQIAACMKLASGSTYTYPLLLSFSFARVHERFMQLNLVLFIVQVKCECSHTRGQDETNYSCGYSITPEVSPGRLVASQC